MPCVTNSEFTHFPGASLDYGVTWELETGEEITSSTWTISTSSEESPYGVVLSNEDVNGFTTAVFVTGGIRGTVYYLVNEIITSSSPARDNGTTIILTCQ